ncbi:MAG: aminoacyl-tRNA hydrolase [Planctomycetota bacterium]
MANVKAVVGIGNPGREYVGTRHNVGFEVLDIISGLRRLNWKAGFSGLFCEFSAGETKMILLKPQTYVNLSGRSVGELVRYFDIPAADVLVISDDFNLALGRIRLRTGGSAGGHNGLASIISAIGFEFNRLRIGIGEPKGDSAAYVLSRFSPVEREIVDIVIRTAADVVEEWLKVEFEQLQRKYNGADYANP